MGIFNWISNNKNSNSNSTTSHKGKITAEKVLAVTELANKLEKFAVFLKNYVKIILNTETEIKKKFEELTAKTKQNLLKESLMKDLWILRYVFLHFWFLELKVPENQSELEDNLLLIKWAFKSALGDINKSDYMTWLETGLIEYTGTKELKFSSLQESKSHILEKVSEKMPLMVFNATKGRLGGELHDGVMELIMLTIQQDKKVFETDNNNSTAEETENIKKIIADLKVSREKAGKEFFDDLLDNEVK